MSHSLLQHLLNTADETYSELLLEDTFDEAGHKRNNVMSNPTKYFYSESWHWFEWCSHQKLTITEFTWQRSKITLLRQTREWLFGSHVNIKCWPCYQAISCSWLFIMTMVMQSKICFSTLKPTTDLIAWAVVILVRKLKLSTFLGYVMSS